MHTSHFRSTRRCNEYDQEEKHEDFVVRGGSVETLVLKSSFYMIFGLTSLNSLCVSLCLIIVANDTADRHAMNEGHRALHAIALSTPFHSRNHPWVF